MFYRLLLLIIFAFSFDFYADEVDGLPELATEKEKRKMQVRRSKVLATSVARRVTKVVENLDLAGQYEEAQTILRKEKKEEQAKALDKDIARFVKIAQQEVDVLKRGLADMKSYDRSMVWYYQAYLNLAYNDNMSAARSNYLKLVKEEDATPQIKLAAYYTLAQLSLSEELYDCIEEALLTGNPRRKIPVKKKPRQKRTNGKNKANYGRALLEEPESTNVSGASLGNQESIVGFNIAATNSSHDRSIPRFTNSPYTLD